jgi:phosphinothricin acetyltransferase
MADVIIDSMRGDDWPMVRAIFAQGIASGHATFETEPPSWDHWTAAHLQHSRFVARLDDQVVGWIALSRVSQRLCYSGVAEVSYYVAADHRGHGIGTRLLQTVIASSEQQGVWMLTAGIFPENTASCRLVAANGFRLVGRRERIGQMNGIWRDTLLYERRSRQVGVE